MIVKYERICKLCLKVAKIEFKEISGIMEQLSDILLVKLDLNITRNPIICRDCVEATKKCLSFKLICIDTEKIILSTSTKNTKQNMDIVYKERVDVETSANENVYVCRFCVTRFDRDNFTSLNALMKDTVFEMLSVYMPELDLNVIENPLICTSCRETAQGYFDFAEKCMSTKEKTKAYYLGEGTDSKAMVNVGNEKDFISNDILEYTYKCPQIIGAIKEESQTSEAAEYVQLEADNVLKEKLELDIKGEQNYLDKTSYHNLSVIRFDKEYDRKTISNTIYLSKKYNNKNCTYREKVQANIMEDILFFNEASAVNTSDSVNKPINKPGKKKERVLKHYSKGTEHKKKNKVNIKKTFSCSLCFYEGKEKRLLKSHMLVHRDISKIQMFKCTLCSYEAKQKRCLKAHMIVHKDASEIGMYTCWLCAFESKRKDGLLRHMKLIHKDASEINMFKCSLCAYETEQKNCLKKHMLTHRNP